MTRHESDGFDLIMLKSEVDHQTRTGEQLTEVQKDSFGIAIQDV